MHKELLLEVKGLKKYYSIRRKSYFDKHVIKAVDGIDLLLNKGDIYGLVGESGCGKSTAGRLIAGIIPQTGGEINIYTDSLEKHKQVQMIFQNSYGVLDPHQKIGDIIEEPLIYSLKYPKFIRKKMVEEIMLKTGLDISLCNLYPRDLSGGQRQRVNIAATLVMGAPLLIADEAVSALDASIQSQILNLLLDLHYSSRLTYIFISHNLNVIRYISDYIGVMYFGKIVESGPCKEICDNPKHPYTQMLLESIPSPFKKNTISVLSRGELPNIDIETSGCAFSPRCSKAKEECRKISPLVSYSADKRRMLRCHLEKV